MSKESKLMHNTILIAISNICTKFVSFFMMPLYTSLLTTAEFGVVDMISTYTSLIAMGINMQLEQGVFRFLVEARGNPQKQKEYISSSLFLLLAAIGVFVLIAVPALNIADCFADHVAGIKAFFHFHDSDARFIHPFENGSMHR